MRQFKTIHAFKVLLYGLGVLLPLATFSTAQEINSQVGAPIGGVDRTVQAGVHAEVTGQPTGAVSPRSHVATSGSKWGQPSGKASLTITAPGTPNAHLANEIQAPTSQSEPIFTVVSKPVLDNKPAALKLGLGQSQHLSHALASASAPSTSPTRGMGLHPTVGGGITTAHLSGSHKTRRNSNHSHQHLRHTVRANQPAISEARSRKTNVGFAH